MRQSLASSPSLITKIQRKSGQVFKEEPECFFFVFFFFFSFLVSNAIRTALFYFMSNDKFAMGLF